MVESIRPSLSSNELNIQVLEVHSQNETIVLLLLATLVSFLLILLLLYISAVCFRVEPSEDSFLPISGSTAGIDCAVCLSVLEDSGTAVRLIKCKHCFHAACIGAWFMSRPICPVCRAPMRLSLAPISSGEGTVTEMAGEIEGSRGGEVGADLCCDLGTFDGQRPLCFLGTGRNMKDAAMGR